MVTATVTLHNRYEIELIDANGNVKQKATAYNVVLDSWKSAMRVPPLGISFGSGSGEPSSSDTSLFSKLWNIKASVARTKIDDRTVQFKLVCNVPASTSYVGTITEVGLLCRADKGSIHSSYDFTDPISHALLKDAEGNPISIVKSDTDILRATAYAFYTLDLSGIGVVQLPIEKSAMYGVGLNSDYGSCGWQLMTSLYLSVDVKGNVSPISVGGTYSDKYAGGVHTAKIATSRMDASVGNTHYYHRLTIKDRRSYSNGYDYGDIGHIIFPNADVFPPKLLSNITVGVGDGATTEFKCPLNLFIEGSDVVYINGVALTRGVDYTIDYRSNQDAMREIMPSTFYAALECASRGKGVQPFTALNKTSTSAPYISAANAWILDLGTGDPLVGIKVNRFYIRGLAPSNYYGSSDENGAFYYSRGLTYIVSYSTDKVSWVEVGRGQVSTSASSVESSAVSISFDAVEARYWKVEIDTSTLTHTNYASSNFTLYYRNTYGMANLYYEGRGIIFTNPPADGSEITMNAQIDRPFKNENFVIDVSAEMTY